MLLHPKEVLNNKWQSQGIQPHFANCWKNFCGNHINQYFWRMKHFALHIEGLIDSQSSNVGAHPKASRCTFCLWTENLSIQNRQASETTQADAAIWTSTALSDTTLRLRKVVLSAESPDGSESESMPPTHFSFPTQLRSLSDTEDSDDTNDLTSYPPRAIIVVNNHSTSHPSPHDSCEHTFMTSPRAVEVWK